MINAKVVLKSVLSNIMLKLSRPSVALTKLNHAILGVMLSSSKCCLKLEEIGQLETAKQNNKYLSGQCFLHKSVAYRGVILCPWKAKVFNKNYSADESKPRNEQYYQTLIDDRDYPFMRIQSNSDKTIKHDNKLLFSDGGLDYVSHQDIIPYKSTNFQPIKNCLFNKLFNVRVFESEKKTVSVNILPNMKLQEWRKRYLPWLNLTQVHKVMKDNICITAMSFYMGKRCGSCWWLLNVKIENLGDETIILQGQELGVYDHLVNDIKILNNKLDVPIKLKEFNLLCHDTVLSPKSPVVQYFNYINLYRANGLAWCYYRIIKDSNLSSIIYPILFFALNSSNDNINDENIDIYFKTVNLCY